MSSEIAWLRLHHQQIAPQGFSTPAEVVAWLGAVQAQDYAAAKWALGLRLPGISEKEVEQAFTVGSILRTHVMRPTWHFVTPADIRWMLALTAPRVHAANASMYRRLELDHTRFLRSQAALARALQGGHQLTRAELSEVLTHAGIPASGLGLVYILLHAELEGVICSGARRGKQFTYALLEERAPEARTLDREEALATLTRRFFTSHGPASLQDFAWWSGLTVADGRVGIDLAGPDLVVEKFDGRLLWSPPSAPPGGDPPRVAHLLPPYDEYTVAYKDYHGILDPQFQEQAKNKILGGAMLLGGQVIGNWRRTFNKQAVLVELQPYRPLSATEKIAFTAAVNHYSKFLEIRAIFS